MTEPFTDRELRDLANLDLRPEESVAISNVREVAAELLTLRSRLAYIIQNGNAWEKAVAQGVHDHAALGTPSEQTPSPPILSVGSRVQGPPLPGGVPLPSARTMIRLAERLGHAIAAGLQRHDDDMQRADDAAATAADPVAQAAAALLDATQPLARALAQAPRPANSPAAIWLDRASAYMLALRAAQES